MRPKNFPNSSIFRCCNDANQTVICTYLANSLKPNAPCFALNGSFDRDKKRVKRINLTLRHEFKVPLFQVFDLKYIFFVYLWFQLDPPPHFFLILPMTTLGSFKQRLIPSHQSSEKFKVGKSQRYSRRNFNILVLDLMHPPWSDHLLTFASG